MLGIAGSDFAGRGRGTLQTHAGRWNGRGACDPRGLQPEPDRNLQNQGSSQTSRRT